MHVPSKKTLTIIAICLLSLFYFFLYKISSDAVTQLEEHPVAALSTSAPTSASNATLKNEQTAATHSSVKGGQISELALRTETLKNTHIDGRLNLDAQGNFIPDKDALTLFDYFLLSQGEIGEQTAIEYIREHLVNNLSAPALTQALAFLDEYNAFRDATRQQALTKSDKLSNLSLNQAGAEAVSFEEVQANYNELQDLRAQHFGAQLSAQLFDLHSEQLQLQRLQVTMNERLNETQKQQQLEALYTQLPADEQALFDKLKAQQNANTAVAALKASGASSEDIWDYRAQIWGEAAADRLAALDQKNALWKQRTDYYIQQKTFINKNSVLTQEQKQRALNDLLNTFSDIEKLRLNAIEELNNNN